jgi:hypothetical protein
MTTGRVAYTLEGTYGGGPQTDPTWIQPGIDISIGDLSVEQALERAYHPDDPTPAGSRPGDWEGAASLSFTLTDANWHDLVLADGGTALPAELMQAPSATWFFGAGLPDGSEESRTPTGTIVPEASVSYERGSDISVELTMLFGDEPDDITEPAEGDIQQPSEDDAFGYYGASFQVDGLNQPLMQSATLSLAGLARFRRGQARHPYDAVTGDAIEPSFSTDATFTERDQLALAVDETAGDVDAPVGEVPATFSLENGQGATIEYSLEACQPNNYNWQNLLAGSDGDLSEPIDYHVGGVSATVTNA